MKIVFKIYIQIFWICLLGWTPLFSDSIKIGISAVFSGPSQELGIHYFNGAKAYFNWVNAQGGVGGRHLQWIAYDDAYNPEPCVQNTKRLIVKDQVDLLFNYVGTPTTTAILPLLKIYEKENIILFGNFTGSGGQRNYPYKPYVFNIRASYKEETEALVSFFMKKGYQKIGIFYQIDSYGRSGYDGVKQKLQSFEKKISAEATYQRGASYVESMEIQTQHFLQEKVDAIISIGSYQACAAFIRDARKIGLDIPIANISFVGTEQLLHLLQKDKISLRHLYFSEVVPHYNQDLPLIREYLALMEKEKFPVNFISLEGFINAKVLVQILQQVPPNQIHRKNIKKIIETMTPIEIGIGGTLQFTSKIHQLFHQIYLYQVDESGLLMPVQ